MSDLAGDFRSTSPYFRLDAIVAQTAEVLRGSEFADPLDLRDVADVANREDTNLPASDEVHSFLDMLHDLARLRD
jgi:hypothetical protein